jgi:hypothetical protein
MCEILSMVEGFLCVWLQENIYTLLLFVCLTPNTCKYFINEQHITHVLRVSDILSMVEGWSFIKY